MFSTNHKIKSILGTTQFESSDFDSVLCFEHGLVRVGEMLLQAGGKVQHLRLVLTTEGDDSDYPGTGMGEGAGLVKDNGIRFDHCLQELAALDCDVLPSCLPHGGQYRQRHGQFQGTGEIHHKHRQCPRHVPDEGKAHQATGKGIGHQFAG